MLIASARAAEAAASSPVATEGIYAEVEMRLRGPEGKLTPVEVRVDGNARPDLYVTLDPAALDAAGPDPEAYGTALGRQLLDGTP
jgi:hypothetical protein